MAALAIRAANELGDLRALRAGRPSPVLVVVVDDDATFLATAFFDAGLALAAGFLAAGLAAAFLAAGLAAGFLAAGFALAPVLERWDMTRAHSASLSPDGLLPWA